MNDGETASRIVWLHNEMVVELKLVPSTKYPIPYVMSWFGNLGRQGQGEIGFARSSRLNERKLQARMGAVRS